MAPTIAPTHSLCRAGKRLNVPQLGGRLPLNRLLDNCRETSRGQYPEPLQAGGSGPLMLLFAR